MSERLRRLSEMYERVVERNAEAVDRTEQLLKVLILVMPAKFGIRSEHTAQAACAAVNLFSLYNKLVALRGETRARKAVPASLADVAPEAVAPLAWASALEHVALFCEMYTGKRLGGAKAKWAAVAVIELARALLQLRLLYIARGDLVARHHLTQQPALLLLTPQQQPPSSQQRPHTQPGARTTITYEESRWWEHEVVKRGRAAPFVRTVAEVLRIVQPLLSLLAMRRWGVRSWRAWLLGLAADLLSRGLHNTVSRGLTPAQRAELARRDWLLLVYILRSPMFELLFGSRAAHSCRLLLDKIPGICSVANFTVEFVRLYRKHHFNLSFI